MPCTIGVGMSKDLPGWVDTATAAIRQSGQDAVELTMIVREAIPASPRVPVLIYYWQFQDGCTTASPTDKSGVNVSWNGRRWSAHWFVVKSCNPRRVVIGDAVDYRFDRATVTVKVRLADLITRSCAPLKWFAATRLLVFDHPEFEHTLPVDTVPDVVVLDPAHTDEPQHPEPPATWNPR